MSRKDYIAIAAVIKTELDEIGFSHPAASRTVRSVAHGLANVFASDNPNFDRGRFLAACGVG